MNTSVPQPLKEDIEALPRRLVRWPQSRGRQWLFAVTWLAFCVGLIWLGYRLYWKLKAGVPLTAAVQVWDHYYPELRTSGVLTADIRPNDEMIDVLMLGASTIENGWGNVEEQLKAGLVKEFGDRVRVFNLARISHTSRDSMLKYSQIADKPFDLILIYDGFNDCRMNNCPREMFRDDYSHCAWYRSFYKRRAAGSISLPHDAMDSAAKLIGNGVPDPGMMKFGGELKTPGPFRHNLETILASAKRSHSLVLLQTFAYCIPDDYSDEKLRLGKLAYGVRAASRRCPLSMWGHRSDVINCIEAHNQIIRELARQNPTETIFVDQRALIPQDGSCFVDPCHFSDTGCQKFVENLLPAVVKRLKERVSSGE